MYIFLKKKWLNYLQTVKILIRRRILRHLSLHCLPVTRSGVYNFRWVHLIYTSPVELRCVCGGRGGGVGGEEVGGGGASKRGRTIDLYFTPFDPRVEIWHQ